MDEDELLAEMEYEESELADQAGGDSSGMTEIILIGFLTVSLLVGGSAAAANYGAAGFNKQRSVEGNFGVAKRAPEFSAVYSANSKVQPLAPQSGGQGAPPLVRAGQ